MVPKQKKKEAAPTEDDEMKLEVVEGTPPQEPDNASAAKPPSPPLARAPSTMDLTVHRLRHLDFIPRAIVCARATPPSLVDKSVSFVALSRETGSIEIKAPNDKFRTIAEIAGVKEKVVSVMAWTCGIIQSSRNDDDETISSRPTLIGGSRDGTLFIVDFESGGFLGTTASGGGGVLALASLCERRAGCCCSDGNRRQCAQLLAAGCEDGTVRIFHIVKPQQPASNKMTKSTDPVKVKLELVSVIPSGSGASVLSVAWMRVDRRIVLFAGISDGTIRRVSTAKSLTKICRKSGSLF